MVAILHEPNNTREKENLRLSSSLTYSYSKTDDENQEGSNNLSIPHQIRGFINGFSMLFPITPNFQYCSACSHSIVSAYISNDEMSSRIEFIEQVCSVKGPEILSNLSGISKLSSDLEHFDFDDDDDDN